jgi:glutamate-1-semialdehyde 2,1-aminomutase/spore coat polysaccharide biosynthesis protein SpsF
MTRVVGIVQARLGASRLPGKMLLDLEGVPVIARTLTRVARARTLDEVVLATSSAPADADLVRLAAEWGFRAFAGSEEDVLARVLEAARAAEADVIVRLTGDCPLHDPDVIDRVVTAFLERREEVDYVSNITPPTYPDGLDVEVIPLPVLERLGREAAERSHREHVTTYIRERLSQFRTLNVTCEDGDLSGLRWTLDDDGDLQFLCAVFRCFAGRDGFGWREVLDLLRARPDLAAANAGRARNEGWMRSLMSGKSAPPLHLEHSEQWWARGSARIPAGTQTLSKGPSQFVDGAAPKYLQRGLGSHVWDVDGNEYIDYPMGLGPVTLGHCHPITQEAVRRQLEEGITFSLMHPLEVEVAELICELVPCAEQVRFGKNGSDVTAAAVRCARALTGRDVVAHCGYHGWQDWYIGSVGGIRARGVPEAVKALQRPFVYNDIASLERIFAEHDGQVAAVIMEVMNTREPAEGFLEQVAALTRRHGAVLIFDEIISGFRYSLGGLQQHYGVLPDLATVGKGMANGMPISAVVGRTEAMRAFDEIFFSFTFGGECLSLAAAKACINFMRREPVVEHFWRQGAKLRDAYTEMVSAFELEGYTECAGLPPWTICLFHDHEGLEGLAMKSLFQQEMLKRGVLFSGSQFLCYEHSDADIRRTVDAYEAAFTVLAHGVRNRCVEQLLEGKKIEPVFRRV